MAVTYTVSGMGFAVLGTTTCHVTDVEYSPNLGLEPFRSGGDIAPSMIRRTGARPVFRLTMPLSDAWTALAALGPVALSDAAIYLAVFDTTTPTSYRTATGATKFAKPASGSQQWACISRIFPQGGGSMPVMMAEVMVYWASVDGVTDPIVTSVVALPTAPAAPTLHVLSTLTDDGTNRWGLTSWSIDFGIGLDPVQSDGFFYPTTYRFNEINASVRIAHKDAVAIMAALTGDGKIASTSFILYARSLSNGATPVLGSTGFSFTFTRAFAQIESIALSGTDVPAVGVSLSVYAAPGTLTVPCTVSTSATIPT